MEKEQLKNPVVLGTVKGGTLIGLPDIRDGIGYILKICNILVRETRDNGDVDYINFTICKDELFPTREALCEHYRKIFE